MSRRNTQSRTRQQREDAGIRATRSADASTLLPEEPAAVCVISPLADKLTQATITLSFEDFQLLQLKQRKLQNLAGQIPDFIRDCRSNQPARRSGSSAVHHESLARAAESTLVFAQEEAGTAFCISSTGLLLTCSHCVADTHDELRNGRDKWLLFSSGRVVRAKCTAWDPKRDLALLQIVAAQSPNTHFPYLTIANHQTKPNTPLLCIGHPGSEDLEASTVGLATDYDVLHISTGRFRGLVVEQDPEDNSEIGALMHDCWTYWGHSGAPLTDRRSGELVGVHSSWDVETGMRRGVPFLAVRVFLEEHANGVLDA